MTETPLPPHSQKPTSAARVKQKNNNNNASAQKEKKTERHFDRLELDVRPRKNLPLVTSTVVADDNSTGLSFDRDP